MDAIPHWDIGNERKDYATYHHAHHYNKPDKTEQTFTNFRKGMHSGMNPKCNVCNGFTKEDKAYVSAKIEAEEVVLYDNEMRISVWKEKK